MHDLSDPAVHRRVRMLKIASAQVIVVGFRRTAQRPKDVEGCETIDLGRPETGIPRADGIGRLSYDAVAALGEGLARLPSDAREKPRNAVSGREGCPSLRAKCQLGI